MVARMYDRLLLVVSLIAASPLIALGFTAIGVGYAFHRISGLFIAGKREK